MAVQKRWLNLTNSKDLWLVAVTCLHAVLLGLAAQWFRSRLVEESPLTWSVLFTWIAFSISQIFLICTNYQCVAHYFIHLPFFKSPWANRAFAIWNSLWIGVPQTLYKQHHLDHHRYNNDAKNEAGKTSDLSSIYKFSRDSGPEGLLSYSFLGPLRTDVWAYFRAARDRGECRLIIFETLALVTFWMTLFAFSWKFFLFGYLPVWYFGQVASLAENYFEHYEAKPAHRLTNSVSCYGGLYNLIWFNNGYHQEHHFHPQTHWTELPSEKAHMLPIAARHVVRGAHLLNWPGISSRMRAREECAVLNLASEAHILVERDASQFNEIPPETIKTF